VDPFYASSILFLGLSFGSFLNVCIYRLPLGLSVVTPRSQCPRCKHLIAFYDNMPVISWLILRGRCRQCKTRISPRYLFIELLTGALFLGCYAYFGLTLATFKYCAFGFLILGLIFTDAETKLLPDKLTLPGLALGIIFSLLVPVNDLASQFLSGVVNLPFSADVSTRLLSLLDSLLGAALGVAAAAAQDTGAKQDMKDAGQDTKDAAKDTGKATKKTAKKATNKAAKKTKQGANKVDDKTKPSPSDNK